MVVCIIVAVIAYLIGSVNFSVIFSKYFAGFDVREKGSGNAGSTNVLRTVGKKAAALTLLCDILKGVVAIALAILIGNIASFDNRSLLVQIAGIGVVLGHTFPMFFGFKGGKGVATALGVLLMSNWKIGLICLIFALVLIALTRMVSLGSISAAILFPILSIFVTDSYIVSVGSGYFIYSIILALVVAFNHRANIERIFKGTENKISFKNKERNLQ